MDLVPIKLRSKEDVCYNLRSYSGYLLILFRISFDLIPLYLFNLDLIPLYFLTDLDLIPSFIVSYSFNIWILFLLKFIKNSKSCLRSYSLDLILSMYRTARNPRHKTIENILKIIRDSGLYSWLPNLKKKYRPIAFFSNIWFFIYTHTYLFIV